MPMSVSDNVSLRGDHTIFYNVRVTPTGLLTSPGTNPHFADITYTLHVSIFSSVEDSKINSNNPVVALS